MTRVTKRSPFLMVVLVLGCGVVAAAPFSDAKHYAMLVQEGKHEATHSFHQDAEVIWQRNQSLLVDMEPLQQAQWYLARADFLQFEHRFEEALQALDKVEKTGFLVSNALLIRARISLTIGALEDARMACQNLRVLVPVDTWATCLLEVEGRSGELPQSYQALKRIAARNIDMSDEVSAWRFQILAEQAQLLGYYNEALQWLDSANYAAQPVVAQKQILDIWFKQNRPEVASDVMPRCPEPDSLFPDSLIVRFARAELESNSQLTCWRSLASERIEIRELRHDRLHTADIAYYHTYVSGNAKAAVYWAELTVAVAREPFDYMLLEAAKELRP